MPLSIARALNYNEQKVKKGAAECIHAHNFLKDAHALNFHEKLLHFKTLIARNKRCRANTLHISLNFAENEKLGRELLAEIAQVYMGKIGFGSQPYLVYRHYDAGHPHIHIVTTNIQMDGTRISVHNLGKNASREARKEIENVFCLVKAKEQNKVHGQNVSPFNIQKVIYGKAPTKRAITAVLDYILPNYKYASLAELNAVLKLYNVVADKGEPGSKIAQHEGLVYRVLNDCNNKLGIPIKASSIPGQPTLRYLKEKFIENETAKQPFKKSIKASIDWVLLSHHISLDSFAKALEKEKITLVVRKNEQEIIYGLTYIDHASKTVFNGSDIGKQYSAKAILEKCGQSQSINGEISSRVIKDLNPKITRSDDNYKSLNLHAGPVPDIITSPLEQNETLAYPFRKPKKKKKRK